MIGLGPHLRNRIVRLPWPVAAMLVAAATLEAAWAAGSGLNVVVVVNQNSSNSLQLANAYCERRAVPPQNVFRMTGWTGGNLLWSCAEFETNLRDPLLAMVASRGLAHQADYVLLSMDIPFSVADGDSVNSTTSALFYGFKFNSSAAPGLPDTCSLPDSSSNSYCYSEQPFRAAPPDTAPTNSFLAMMLTDTTLAGAQAILDRGAASDSTFPTQAVYLAKTSDAVRNVRYVTFDNAVFDGRVLGDYSLVRLTTDGTGFTNLLGLETGLASESLPTNAFAPGALADTLTSYAGLIFGDNLGQTPLLAFLNAGAAGSYGTVTEPCNYLQKFPDPLDYIYQLRGFSLAEAYYQSVQNPFEGLMVGEPLSAPFARPGTADWSSLTNGVVVRGQQPLSVVFFAAATNLPFGAADLFVDGTFLETVTNLLPAAGNLVTITLNGFTVNYTVPTNATVASVAAELADALNGQTNVTQVQAHPYGDRLELDSLDLTSAGSNLLLSVSATAGSAPNLTTLVTAARPAFLDTIASGDHYVLVSNTPAVGDWLQLTVTKTNGIAFNFAATNTSAGATIGQLVESLLGQLSAEPALQLADGVYSLDYFDYAAYGQPAAEFYLYAGSPGWPAAQIQVMLAASSNLVVVPAGVSRLDDNLSDLQPRNHLLVRSGALALPLDFTLNTTALPDGFHRLTAVAYEGSSVRTQTAISRDVCVQNTALAATFTLLAGGANTDLGATLGFSVVANTNPVNTIELFSTGGSLSVVSNQAAAAFSVAGTNLGLGLHPFYAVVTASGGAQYRTETKWIRLLGPEPPFTVSIASPPVALSWPATAGRSYDVLSSTNLQGLFQVQTSLIPSNGTAVWADPNAASSPRFYRVRTSN
jgi:uncharacterized protein (TIGR03790 family)